MKRLALVIAVDEAKRFIAKAEDYFDREKDERGDRKDNQYALYGCKESGAVKRSSLDLSRALANMRRP